MTGNRIFAVIAAFSGVIGAESPQIQNDEIPSPPVSERLQAAGFTLQAAAAIQADLSKKAFSQAETKILAQIENSPHPGALLEILGGVFFLDHNYLQAAIAYKKAESHGALTENARFTLVMSYIELKRTNWARDELSLLRKEKPSQALYVYWLGRIEYDNQAFANGIVRFNEALSIDPQFVRAYDGRALCEEAIGDLAAAEKSYKRANTLNRRQTKPSSSPPLDYGTMLTKAGRSEEAIALLKEALTIDPQRAKAYYELGRIEESRSNIDTAIPDFEIAAKLDPNDPSPVYRLFGLYSKTGDKQRADEMEARFRTLRRAE